MQVLFFGALAESAGKSEIQMDKVKDVDHLKSHLLSRYPKLQNHTFRIAVNKKVESVNVPLHENDVVAFLPPFSGG